jgi:subtilase family serine protease
MRRSLAVAAVVTTVAAAVVPLAASAAAPVTAAVGPRPVPATVLARLSAHEFGSLPTSAQCRTVLGIECYTATQLRTAYAVTSFADGSIDGRGTTIAVVVSFGSPTIERDVHTFDQALGLSDPPAISTISPAGPPPSFDGADPEMLGWAYETTLDVEYAHAMAPGAAILVVATPVSETEGVQGFPEIMRAEQYVVDHHLADVITQSFGATESTFPSRASVLDLRQPYRDAAARGITVLAASGDTGPTGYESDLTTLSPTASTTWPASDPLVTAVGGTTLHLAATGQRLSDDTVWSDSYGASGGGVSHLFGRPRFQDGVADVVGRHRGTPDVAMSAAVDGGVLVYSSYDPGQTGWSVVGGTSEATPVFAGVVALATELAGKGLGDINPLLYQLASVGDGLIDVTMGDNSFGGVDGYSAAPGYDLASGWGTVDAGDFVPALAAAAQRRG